jgi:hypothetical protein
LPIGYDLNHTSERKVDRGPIAKSVFVIFNPNH